MLLVSSLGSMSSWKTCTWFQHETRCLWWSVLMTDAYIIHACMPAHALLLYCTTLSVGAPKCWALTSTRTVWGLHWLQLYCTNATVLHQLYCCIQSRIGCLICAWGVSCCDRINMLLCVLLKMSLREPVILHCPTCNLLCSAPVWMPFPQGSGRCVASHSEANLHFYVSAAPGRH